MAGAHPIPRAAATAVIEVGALLRPQAPEPDLWLLFAPVKRDATELLVQKATELGVAALMPVLTARTNTGHAERRRLDRDRHRGGRAMRAPDGARESNRRAGSLTCSRAGRMARVLVGAIERAAARRCCGPCRTRRRLLVGPEGGFDAGGA